MAETFFGAGYGDKVEATEKTGLYPGASSDIDDSASSTHSGIFANTMFGGGWGEPIKPETTRHKDTPEYGNYRHFLAIIVESQI